MTAGGFKLLNQSMGLSVAQAEKFYAVAAFSTRQGGLSPPPLDSLNFSVKQGDTPQNVQINLQLFAQYLHIGADHIVTCNQVHGDTIAIVKSLPFCPEKADALIAVGPGIFPGVKTADCLPILLLDPAQKISAAIHAGWRGTALRIARKVVRIMQREFNTDIGNLFAAMGPAIGACCYSVDRQVVDPIKRNIPNAESFITQVKPNHDKNNGAQTYQCNLEGINRFELVSMGVDPQNIYSADQCTSCQPDLFFSHRRDGTASGRHLSVVGFKE